MFSLLLLDSDIIFVDICNLSSPDFPTTGSRIRMVQHLNANAAASSLFLVEMVDMCCPHVDVPATSIDGLFPKNVSAALSHSPKHSKT